MLSSKGQTIRTGKVKEQQVIVGIPMVPKLHRESILKSEDVLVMSTIQIILRNDSWHLGHVSLHPPEKNRPPKVNNDGNGIII